MGFNKKFFTTGGIVASSPTTPSAPIDPFSNFETVAYEGNGSTNRITGYIRKGAAFNGSSSKVVVSQNTDFDATGGISISLWINKNSITSTNSRIMDKAQGGSGSYGWEMMYNTTRGYRFDVNGVGNSHRFVFSGSGGISAVGIWDHVVATCSSTGVATIYVNGTATSPTSALPSGEAISTNTNGVTIGQYFNGVNQANAKFDQLRFFNKDLSQAEVNTLKDETYSSASKSITDIFEDNSGFALYEFDVNADDTLGNYTSQETEIDYLGMAFKPDLIWTKQRNTTRAHVLQDSVRGRNLFLDSSSDALTSDFTSENNSLMSFDANGFTLGSNTNERLNVANGEYVSWCWKASNSSAQNNDGSINGSNCVVSANPSSGFSIVKYNGNGTAGATCGHGLSSVDFIMIKRLDATGDWVVGSNYITNWATSLFLNTAAPEASFSAAFNSTAPSGSVFTIGNDNKVNNSSGSYIAYCFSAVQSYQKFGNYVGASGRRVYTTTNGASGGSGGFKPRYLLVKQRDSTNASWQVFDYVRVSAANEGILFPDLDDREPASTNNELTFNNDGFTWNNTDNGKNKVNANYLYWAIA